MLMLSLSRCGDWASTCDYDINTVYRKKERELQRRQQQQGRDNCNGSSKSKSTSKGGNNNNSNRSGNGSGNDNGDGNDDGKGIEVRRLHDPQAPILHVMPRPYFECYSILLALSCVSLRFSSMLDRPRGWELGILYLAGTAA